MSSVGPLPTLTKMDFHVDIDVNFDVGHLVYLHVGHHVHLHVGPKKNRPPCHPPCCPPQCRLNTLWGLGDDERMKIWESVTNWWTYGLTGVCARMLAQLKTVLFGHMYLFIFRSIVVWYLGSHFFPCLGPRPSNQGYPPHTTPENFHPLLRPKEYSHDGMIQWPHRARKE